MTTEKTIIHKFEESGLGIAPFSVQDVVSGDQWHSCDYCSTAIKQLCIIRDRNGKTFIVGNECVRHTGDSGLIDTVRRALNELKRVARHEREAARISEGKAKLESSPRIKAILSLFPHPFAHHAEKGKTLLDYVEYMFHCGGNAGKIEAIKIIEKHEDHSISDSDVRAWDEENKRLIEDAARRASQAKTDEQLRQEANARANAWLIAILNDLQYESDFTRAMIEKLAVDSLADFSDRQRAILKDVYAKSSGGRRGSQAYRNRETAFDLRVDLAIEEKQKEKSK